MSMKRSKRNQLEIVPTHLPAKEDKRAFCRFVLPDLPVRFKDLRLGTKGEGCCKDFSGSGAGFACSEEIKPKTPLELWFDLADGFAPVHLLGKSVWSKSSGINSWRVGVAFERQRLLDMARVLKCGA